MYATLFALPIESIHTNETGERARADHAATGDRAGVPRPACRTPILHPSALGLRSSVAGSMLAGCLADSWDPSRGTYPGQNIMEAAFLSLDAYY
eukprot:6212075-Pleurochrysis_carterae.AAC.4